MEIYLADAIGFFQHDALKTLFRIIQVEQRAQRGVAGQADRDRGRQLLAALRDPRGNRAGVGLRRIGSCAGQIDRQAGFIRRDGDVDFFRGKTAIIAPAPAAAARQQHAEQQQPE